jgi:hypothetical protein
MHPTKNITAPDNINGASIHRTGYGMHRTGGILPWLLMIHKMHRTDNITRRVRSAHRVTLMMHGMHPTKNITAPNNINGASIHRIGGIERGY